MSPCGGGRNRVIGMKNGKSQPMTERMQVMWVAVIATYGIGDIVLTTVGLLNGIPETHPATAAVVSFAGIAGFVGLRLADLTCVYVVYRVLPARFSRVVPVFYTILGSFIVGWNTVAITM